MPIVRYEVNAGETIKVKGARLTLFSRSFQILPPGGSAGLNWSRPSSVLVETADGAEQILPVRDVTRLAQLRLLAAGLLGSLLVWLIFRK